VVVYAEVRKKKILTQERKSRQCQYQYNLNQVTTTTYTIQLPNLFTKATKAIDIAQSSTEANKLSPLAHLYNQSTA
jgi:hypothetical protein